jgi:hypothetical protein
MEQSINEQGLRLVQQSEGINVPLLQPWEVEGEKELIKDPKLLKLVTGLETNLSALYEHMQKCKDPSCNAESTFNKIMNFRRQYCLSLVKEENHTMYEVIVPLIILRLMAKGDDDFQTAVLTGLGVSSKILLAL